MTGRQMLQKYGFRRGNNVPPLELSPAFSSPHEAMLRSWLETLPVEFTAKIPRIKAAPAAELTTPQGHPAHAAAFIPECYLLLAEPLFRRRGELGRILFHELCHFLWPRLSRGRGVYEAALRGRGGEGELGFSATLARQALRPGSAAARDHLWKHYLCESFCDTGAWLLLRRAGHRRRHSEWTLPVSGWKRRAAAWQAALGVNILPPDKVKLTL